MRPQYMLTFNCHCDPSVRRKAQVHGKPHRLRRNFLPLLDVDLSPSFSIMLPHSYLAIDVFLRIPGRPCGISCNLLKILLGRIEIDKIMGLRSFPQPSAPAAPTDA